MLPKSVKDLIDHFDALPGVGPRQAARFVFSLLRAPTDRVERFGQALQRLPQATTRCQRCQRIMENEEHDTCHICRDTSRDATMLCIVGTDQHLEALEETGMHRGLYHVLGGSIDPLEERKNEQLTLDALFSRLEKETPKEILIATDSTTAGDTTALELVERLKERGNFTITRLGRGLSTGSEIEYMDTETLRNAIERRVKE